ncbi:hypothetical protein GOBAR_AA04292 [Gossypium barbadense]|uniref:Uncharacterized protein n=1 Tax=Gossypium barbadense TaxID=3634 RepID=A0A2P5YL11_GOSBA|nr:hypothetical protein GOBAR_AA04292 [Gossypium barbadense]
MSSGPFQLPKQEPSMALSLHVTPAGLTSYLGTFFDTEISVKETVLWSSVQKWASAEIRIHDSKPSHRDLRELPARKGNKQQIHEKAEQEMARKSQHISQRYRRHEMERNRRFLSQNM